MASCNPKCKNRLHFSNLDCIIFFLSFPLVHGRRWQIRRNFHSLMLLDFFLAWKRNIWRKISEFYQRAPLKCSYICCGNTCATANSAGNCFVFRCCCCCWLWKTILPFLLVQTDRFSFSGFQLLVLDCGGNETPGIFRWYSYVGV